MRRFSRFIFKSLPYLVSFLIGIIFYFLSGIFTLRFQNLLVNLSSVLISISIVFLSYEIIKELVERKLNKRVYNYAKWKIDSTLLSIMGQLTKRVSQIDDKTNMRELGFYLNRNELSNKIRESKYVGFQVLKKFDIDYSDLKNLLENPFILSKMTNREIISILEIIRRLEIFEGVLQTEKLFLKTNEVSNSYSISKMVNTADQPSSLSFYLIFRKADKSSTFDFGYFDFSNEMELLNIFRVNENHLAKYSDSIFSLLREIENWFILTGKKILIDTRDFKPINKDLN